jgi:hypothetical protein
MCQCKEPEKEYSKEGCHSCWICKKCGHFGGCDNLVGRLVSPEEESRGIKPWDSSVMVGDTTCIHKDWVPIGYPREVGVYHTTSIYDVYCSDCKKFINLFSREEIEPAGREPIRESYTPPPPSEELEEIKPIWRRRDTLEVIK